MKVVVTGGAGFIGVNLGLLLGASHELVAFDNFSVGSPEAAADAGYAQVVHGDIRSLDQVMDAVVGADAVVHLAAQTGVPSSLATPLLDMEMNVVGSVNVLEACRVSSVGRVVLASSAAPLGATPPPAHENVVPRPLSPYGASKLSMEAYASAWAGSFGVATYTLRFSNVYGPWSYLKGSVVARWMKLLLDGENIRINGSGLQTRDFVHVDDICAAISLAVSGAGVPGLYQLGTGVETSVIDLAGHITSLFGKTVSDCVEFGDPLIADVPRSYCDIAKAREHLGYDPTNTIPEGLLGTQKWFEQYMR